MSPRRVLVTGGSGRFGRFVVADLMRQADVTVFDLVAAPADVPSVTANVLDLDALRRAAKGHDAMIHLAGLDSGVAATEHDYFEVNTVGTFNALQAAETAGIERVAVCSSIAAYGLEPVPPRRTPDILPFDEDHPLRPDVAYDLSKAVVETIAASFSRKTGMVVPCLRPAWIIFPGKEADFDTRCREADGGDPVPPGHRLPPPHRAYVRPDDAATAFRLALTAPLQGAEPLNIGADDTMSPAPTLDVMARTFREGIPQHETAPFRTDPRAAAFSNERARKVLSWAPTGRWDDFVAAPLSDPFAKVVPR